MKYQVNILRAAEKDMEKQESTVHARISQKILSLETDPRPGGVKKLSGREEYRLRVGDYRVLYTVNDKANLVTVSAVGHRKEVYR